MHASSGRLSREHFFKTAEQMAKLFADLPEALANTIEIARRCAFRPAGRKPILPRFVAAAPGTSEAEQLKLETAELRTQAEAGLAVRLGDRSGMKLMYHTLARNCTTELVRVIDQTVAYSPWRSAVKNATFFMCSIPTELPHTLRIRGLLADGAGSRMPDLDLDAFRQHRCPGPRRLGGPHNRPALEQLLPGAEQRVVETALARQDVHEPQVDPVHADRPRYPLQGVKAADLLEAAAGVALFVQ